MRRCLVDTNVFLYARGREHEYREPCRTVLTAARTGRVGLIASVELVQEFAHVLLRRGVPRADALDQAEEVRAQCDLRAFDGRVLAEAMRMLRPHPGLAVRDAVHAATAVLSGVQEVLSTDQAFDALDDVRRLDPLVLADWLDDETS